MDLLSAFTTQWEQAKHFWCTPALRLPILNIWVATFGGALHAPCTTFFLLELGLTNTEIGNGGMLMSFPDLILAPLYGYAFDRFGAYPVICTTAACCAFGCLVRGFLRSASRRCSSSTSRAIIMALGHCFLKRFFPRKWEETAMLIASGRDSIK